MIRRDRVSPGGIELRDIPTYIGSGLIEIVLKDPFGREQRIPLPYYYSDRHLKKGLHEFSYNIGFEREDFGIVSNRYKNFSFLGFHRYGLSNTLTVGVRGEATKDVVNMGVSATTLLPKQFGVIDASLAWSGSRGREDGMGGSLGYLYQDRHLSFNLLLRAFTKDYSNISLEKTTERTKYEVSAGGGYTSEWLGSFSIHVARTKKYQGTDSKSLFAGYSRKITNRSNIFANFKRDFEGNLSEFMIGINYYFNHGIMASASHQRTDGNSSERIQVIKNLPMGEGFGGRASYERVHKREEDYNNFNVQLQYNAKYGQYGGEFISTNHVESYSFTAAGALTFVKDSFNITRPIQDSFALVKVGDLKGVRVNLSNQEIGRTGASGKVLIPNLNSYYDNQISINDKDIPMEYTLSEVMKYVSPPYRSGSYIEFGITKIQGFVGLLKVKVEGEVKPVEYIEFKLMVDGKELVIPTGKGGEFYIENIRPGRYKGEFKYLDKPFIFDIMIPKSDEVVVELGEVLCE
ncbi:MAG: fimbria/pilus outer membrane usher protein [Thermodesulfobacteriota bacterium]